jgi:hypothetical protein
MYLLVMDLPGQPQILELGAVPTWVIDEIRAQLTLFYQESGT